MPTVLAVICFLIAGIVLFLMQAFRTIPKNLEITKTLAFQSDKNASLESIRLRVLDLDSPTLISPNSASLRSLDRKLKFAWLDVLLTSVNPNGTTYKDLFSIATQNWINTFAPDKAAFEKAVLDTENKATAQSFLVRIIEFNLGANEFCLIVQSDDPKKKIGNSIEQAQYAFVLLVKHDNRWMLEHPKALRDLGINGIPYSDPQLVETAAKSKKIVVAQGKFSWE